MAESVYHGEMGNAIKFIESIADPLNSINLFLSIISINVNILHAIILTRSSMKSTSTNVIMIGIAIIDIFTLTLTVFKHISLVDIENNECVTSKYIWKIYFDMAIWALQDYFRRCSTWLGLFLALVRTLIVQNLQISTKLLLVCLKCFINFYSSTTFLTRPKFGKLIVFCVIAMASTLSIFYNLRFEVVEYRMTSLPLSCEEFQDIHQPPRFSLSVTSFFAGNEKLILRIYLMVDAIVSKFIPCLFFPVLTILLIHALNKAKKARKKKKSLLKDTDHTTKLVVFMTAAFFFAEAPVGVIYMINAFYQSNDGLIIASVDVIIVFASLLTINSTCHFIFCIFLSRQYRNTLYYTLRLDRLVNSQRTEATRNMSSVAVPSMRLVSVR